VEYGKTQTIYIIKYQVHGKKSHRLMLKCQAHGRLCLIRVLNFLSTAAGFGDATGNTSSGTPGSGGGGCFIAGTPITMADGTTKPVEQVDLRDEVAVGGYVFATGKFIIDNLYEYKGIKVSGTHGKRRRSLDASQRQ
jgi:hypothetical protein